MDDEKYTYNLQQTDKNFLRINMQMGRGEGKRVRNYES